MSSATDRLSTGTVIFPMSKHIDYCLSQSDRTSRSNGIREKVKNKVCQSSCAKCHQSILNGHRHLPEVETHRSVSLPVAIGPAVRTLFANKDCANRNRHVPSATDRLSTGTVIFPMSKQIDYCLSQSDRTSRSDGIREKAKNKVCQSSCAKCHQSSLNGHRHIPEIESHRLVPLPFRSNQPFGRYSCKG